MEKNKLDSSQIIGFLFLIAAFVSLYMFQPVVEEPIENNDTNTDVEPNSKRTKVIDTSML